METIEQIKLEAHSLSTHKDTMTVKFVGRRIRRRAKVSVELINTRRNKMMGGRNENACSKKFNFEEKRTESVCALDERLE